VLRDPLLMVKKRTPALGLLDSISAPLGMDSNMANAIPGKDITSSLGLEKVVSGLGLKRGLVGLDDLMGMTGLRNSPLGPAVIEQPGDVMPVISSFVPLDMTGSPIAPGGRPEIGGQKAVEDLPVVGEMADGIPLEPLEGLLRSIGAGGLVKRREKRSRMVSLS